MNLDECSKWSLMKGRCIIPNLPDLVLYRVFELLSYKEIVRLEMVCKRWRSIVFRLLRKHIQELDVEQSNTYRTFSAVQQKPLKRLSVRCNFDATNFLSGVLRRSRMSITKLTCDIRFLANMEQLNLDRERNRRYWSNVEDLWIVLVRLDNETTKKFLSIHKLLFLNLSRITVQIHESREHGKNICRVISAIVDQFPKLTINMELHANSSIEVFGQLMLLPPLTLESLKLVCLDYDPQTLPLTEFARIIEKQMITMGRFVLRDWTVQCEPNERLFCMPIENLRLSSCAIENVDNFISAMHTTFCSYKNSGSKEKLSTEKTMPEADTLAVLKNCQSINPEDFGSRTAKKPIGCVELAGQCMFYGLGYLEKKAHQEFEFRLRSVLPSVMVDSSHICYSD